MNRPLNALARQSSINSQFFQGNEKFVSAGTSFGIVQPIYSVIRHLPVGLRIANNSFSVLMLTVIFSGEVMGM